MIREPGLLEIESLGVRAGGRWIVEGVTFFARAGDDDAPVGRIGLASKADSQVLFDDFQVTALGPSRAP